MSWKDLEDQVREIASHLWLAPAAPEHIAGVDVDCVVKAQPDYWHCVEISEETRLAKLRSDLAKFAVIRPALLQREIYSKCYFVCKDLPRGSSLPETGRANNVQVLTVDQFRGLFFDYPRYHHARSARAFGSAVNPFSGEKDERAYIPVTYVEVKKSRKRLSVDELVRAVLGGRRVILLGEYGTGKSRCVQEIFGRVKPLAADKWLFPLSIDLRNCWGIKRGHILVRRHFDDLGMESEVDRLIRVLDRGRVPLLIDGFDEIGSQAWSDDPATLREIRRRSLAAVRDLLSTTKSGALITGRAHYFDSHSEMFDCLGLDARKTLVVRCQDQFSEDEFSAYLSTLSPGQAAPEWLPRRPLVCQLLSTLKPGVLEEVLQADSGESAFWYTFIRAVCERDALMNVALSTDAIRDVLVKAARITRSKPDNLGPISMKELNRAFEEVLGYPPTDESAVILQRLPPLGWTGVESPERKFIDIYILDGLRAEDVIREAYSDNAAVVQERWLHPLQAFGIRRVSGELSVVSDCSSFVNLMRKAAGAANKVLAGDIAAALLAANDATFDFGGLAIEDAHISTMDLTNSRANGLTIRNSVIDAIKLSNARPTNFALQSCLIRRVDGVSDARGLPSWIPSRDNHVEEFEAVTTVVKIKRARLSTQQRVFVTFIRKTFFQPGSARKEEALLRGLGDAANRRAADKVLRLLLREDILTKFRGDDGPAYAPDRSQTRRMQEILQELTLSEDPLWKALRPDD